MNSTRLQKLLEYLKEDPNDPFTLYAIATEFVQSSPGKAREYFDQLLLHHPDYLATYYHAAKLYSDLGNAEKAKEIFLKGIEIARVQENSLALRELQNAYNEFLFDQEQG